VRQSPDLLARFRSCGARVTLSPVNTCDHVPPPQSVQHQRIPARWPPASRQKVLPGFEPCRHSSVLSAATDTMGDAYGDKSMTFDTVVFRLDPSRSHEVPEGHFPDHARLVLMVDRYSAYKAMAQVKLGTRPARFRQRRQGASPSIKSGPWPGSPNSRLDEASRSTGQLPFGNNDLRRTEPNTKTESWKKAYDSDLSWEILGGD
jgi:hypothetical protein